MWGIASKVESSLITYPLETWATNKVVECHSELGVRFIILIHRDCIMDKQKCMKDVTWYYKM
jgi:hypothetical protein